MTKYIAAVLIVIVLAVAAFFLFPDQLSKLFGKKESAPLPVTTEVKKSQIPQLDPGTEADIDNDMTALERDVADLTNSDITNELQGL